MIEGPLQAHPVRQSAALLSEHLMARHEGMRRGCDMAHRLYRPH